MIEESYVSFKTACMLKDAGFEANVKTRFIQEDENEWCFADGGVKRTDYNYFDDTVTCPTHALAASWLRIEHGLHVYAIQTNLPLTEPQTDKWEWGYVIDKVDSPNTNSLCNMYYPDYESAMEAGIQKGIELIKNEI